MHKVLLQHTRSFRDDHLFRASANLTLEEAASLPTAGGVAAHALFWGPITAQEGTTVLTQGNRRREHLCCTNLCYGCARGLETCWLWKLAAASGTTVISTSCSDQKLDIARGLGARHAINYKMTPH